MSEEGLLKKRKVEETILHSSSSSSNAIATFFSMVDLVHHDVSPFLSSWADHRALGCTTAALWRYYKKADQSTRAMFFFHGQRPVASLRVRETFLMDSRDMRCIQWLWGKKQRNALVGTLAREFCKAGARAGCTDAILRYVKHLNDAEIQAGGFGQQIFRTLCKYGHDEEAQAHLLANRWKRADESPERYISKLSIVMAPFAHLVPKTFAVIKSYLVGQQHLKEGLFYVFFLVNACSGNMGYDTRAFDWVWAQLPPGLHTVQEWGALFLKDILETIEFEPFRSQTVRILGRVPAIVKKHFAEFTTVSDGATLVKLNDLILSFTATLPPDAKGEVLVSFVIWFERLRVSRGGISMPYDCL